MARRFVDARGTEWEVWEVVSRPTLADRAPRSGGRDLEAAQLFGQAQELFAAAARRHVRAHRVGEAEQTDLIALRRRDVAQHQRRVHGHRADDS